MDLRLPGQTLLGAGQSGLFPLQPGGEGGGALQRLQIFLHLSQPGLQLGDVPHAFVDLPPVFPGLQLLHSLGEGHVLLPRRDQGGDAPLQLGGGGEGQVSLPQKGGAGEHLRPHSGEQLAAVGGGETGHRLLGAGVDGGEGPERGVSPGAPADGDVPALVVQGDLSLHGGSGPGLIAVLVSEIALFVPVPGVDAVEHGPPEGGPGGFTPLVGGVDEGETGSRLQPGPLQPAEGGGHGFDFHGSSPLSKAASPYRAAS